MKVAQTSKFSCRKWLLKLRILTSLLRTMESNVAAYHYVPILILLLEPIHTKSPCPGVALVGAEEALEGGGDLAATGGGALAAAGGGALAAGGGALAAAGGGALAAAEGGGDFVATGGGGGLAAAGGFEVLGETDGDFGASEARFGGGGDALVVVGDG